MGRQRVLGSAVSYALLPEQRPTWMGYQRLLTGKSRKLLKTDQAVLARYTIPAIFAQPEIARCASLLIPDGKRLLKAMSG